jgi:hypothetical protein
MPEISTDLAWYPPEFPAQGRLPSHAELVGKNGKKQASLERQYRDELCAAADKVVPLPCCKTLHISLFFDGTGNNLNNDFYLSNPRHPTNIARLFRATIGSGTAGGVSKTSGLFDTDAALKGSYFKYYMPGVGTPFPEINDLDYSMKGLAFADKGEDRINWGLLRIIDALKRSLSPPNADSSKLSEGETRDALKNMATSWASLGLTGSHNRYEEFTRQLKMLEKELRPALHPTGPGQPKLLGIKLYVYGFSRGAAAARTFVRWLSELLPKPEKDKKKPEQCLAVGDLKIPLSVEFLGILDTVASVGMAHMLPLAEGHMAWADGTQELPEEATYGGFIKRCVHLVSSHEQRLCFPLDSIRRSNGKYPANSVEVIYPGMHSDIGGGYPPGDQGKAVGESEGYLLSQIILQDLYSQAFKAGAPLKVIKQSLPPDLASNKWRVMPLDLVSQFYISEILIKRFNAWRELTLNQPQSASPITDERAAEYEPPRAPVSLEKAVENQIAWITAWRINRYAGGKMFGARFYKDASEKHGVPGVLEQAKVRWELDQGAVRARRKAKIDNQPADKMNELVLEPGIKDFDPDVAQTQLQQAAREFDEDYRDVSRSVQSSLQLVLDVIPRNAIFLINSDDERQEFAQIKREGESKVQVLFPPSGEESNASQPGGLMRALFDDQVHDSRAWFMHYALNGRELWGGYFRYRMIYFGDNCNKSLSPLVIAGNVVGAATLVGGVIFSFKQKGTAAKMAGLAGTAGIFSLESEALDFLTGLPVAMSPDAAKLKAFTSEPGVVVAQQTAAVQEQRLALAKSIINSEWAKEASSALLS